MADAWTSQFGNNYSPQAHLSIGVVQDTHTTAVISWAMYYVAHGYAAYTNGIGRGWSVDSAGDVRDSGSYNINGQTGTVLLGNGTFEVGKTHATQGVGASCSFNFDVNWAGVYSGVRSASTSFLVGPKTSYMVSYNANGGSGAPSNQTKWHDENLTLSNTKPTRTGYTFDGWATSADGAVEYQAGGTYSGNGNLTLYAKWTAITYQVTYDANGGTGAPAAQTKTYGVALTLSSTTPTRTNYNFLGWGTSAGATTVTYLPGASYTDNTDLALFAVWEIAYIQPKITNLDVERCTEDGTSSDEGTYIEVSFNWELDAIYSGGMDYIRIGYKRSSDSEYTTSDYTPTGMTGFFDEIVGEGTIDTEYVYDVQVIVKDQKGNTTINRSISSLAYIIDFLSGGGGVAIGKPAVNKGFEVATTAKFENDITVEKTLAMGDNATVSGNLNLDVASKFLFNNDAFLQARSDGRPVITNDLGLANNVPLQAQLMSGVFADILRMNESDQVELNWTTGGIRGRVYKTLWTGTWSSGSITVPELPYYNVFLVRVSISTDFGMLSNNIVTARSDVGSTSNVRGIGYIDWGSMFLLAADFRTNGTTASNPFARGTYLNASGKQYSGSITDIYGLL
jgi:uncharacterized repeat protein (TIGR02543 family)